MLGIFQDSKDIRLLINFREGGTELKTMTKLEEMVGELVLG